MNIPPNAKDQPTWEQPVQLILTQEQYMHLVNVLLWAELYDVGKNEGHNRHVYDSIAEVVPYRTDGPDLVRTYREKLRDK